MIWLNLKAKDDSAISRFIYVMICMMVPKYALNFLQLMETQKMEDVLMMVANKMAQINSLTLATFSTCLLWY